MSKNNSHVVFEQRERARELHYLFLLFIVKLYFPSLLDLCTVNFITHGNHRGLNVGMR